MEPKSQKTKKHPGLMLFLLSIVFIGPLLFAWVMYLKSEDMEFKTTNAGKFVTPTILTSQLALEDDDHHALDVDTLKGKWWLVYLSPENCYNACHDILYNMRQIQTALGKESHRVERMVLAHQKPNDPLAGFIRENYPEIKRGFLGDESYKQYFSHLSDPEDRNALGELVIIDPHGQVVLHYDGDIPSKGILTDLKKLLQASQIG